MVLRGRLEEAEVGLILASITSLDPFLCPLKLVFRQELASEWRVMRRISFFHSLDAVSTEGLRIFARTLKRVFYFLRDRSLNSPRFPLDKIFLQIFLNVVFVVRNERFFPPFFRFTRDSRVQIFDYNLAALRASNRRCTNDVSVQR